MKKDHMALLEGILLGDAAYSSEASVGKDT